MSVDMEKGMAIGVLLCIIGYALSYLIYWYYSFCKKYIKEKKQEKLELLERIKKLEFFKDSNESNMLALEYEIKDLKKKLGAKK